MAGKKYANDEQLAEGLANALQDLPDNWVMCRDMRHAWNVSEDFHVAADKAKGKMEIRRTLTCMRCETERHETYFQTKWGLDKVKQHYVYPDAYQIKGVPRGVKPSYIVQGEMYRRTMSRIAASAKHKIKAV